MSDPESDDAIADSALGDARLAYGAALVDEELTWIECVDAAAFEDGADRSLLTALTTVGAELVSLAREAEDADLPETAAPQRSAGVVAPRVEAFDDLADCLERADAYYVLLDCGDDQWRRLREADPDALEARGAIDTADAARRALAAALVAESADRTAEFDVEVDEQDPIQPIAWGE